MCETCQGTREQDFGGPFWHVWMRVDGQLFDPTWGYRCDAARTGYFPEEVGRAGLILAIDRHGDWDMFESRAELLRRIKPAMPALRGED